ncbi:alpha-glucosidase [Tetragenococcus halophilus]|uniref:Glucan 1,6-alpha-glucosidase n=2 Tax=Tetragenococcus halophilus TaxID=51669 RepID=A0AAN1SHF3_TETHN|nr:alpha-glucosidase [Tetragenococcus halophilus]MCO8289038.1 alpha-glucosidase [Tetragenococcus halophilus]MCO8291059.1 alpha-glucosidase [Tetragenococcus halophilus]MCO8295605.1 alpha-glucosidase [Tetragenococcus halophilus]NRR75220.1 alpha-glucosidase [Tetragenococcus halophilus]QGP75365.1 alpha,alpha-phosphotrehalase [Tetragenococcus halophilus]
MEKNWWKNAVIYQIYPRSFQDSNGDGIGDLNGIIQKLDYLQYLGIDAIWLSPVYQSPNVDNGYDISDYQTIDPEYGTMEDMDRLIDEANKRSIKIIMDLVINHTSSQHFWFQEALKGKDNPYHEYYIWRTSNNSEPPNSLKADSGSAWEYVSELDEYYLHLHSKEQPDLNWKNPEMKQAIWEMINYWLEKGIGGFRLDVIDLIGKEPDELITKNGPELHPLIHELNQQTFGNYNVVTVGETWGATPEIAKLYSKPERNELSMVFQFEHINLDKQAGKRKWDLKELDPQELHQVFSKWQTELQGDGWNSLFWNNHDLPRIISRWGDDSKQYRELSGKMLAIYLYFMSGTPYIYQGEEIGMTNYEISDISEVNDIESRQMYYDRLDKGYPKEEVLQSINTKGRDNARHPMQWDLSKNAGFTTATPWLAVHPNYKSINVETSLANQDSLFFTYKELIELRKNNYDIINGEYQTLNTGNPDVLAYIRYNDNEQIIVVVNFSKQSQQYSLQTNLNHSKCLIHNYNTGIGGSKELQAYEAFAVKVSGNNW